ncbi:MAG: hypothetical protein L0221_17710 [Chloroflexi bacterium]|nr:hypothetical protein [Chloroflexota bacterium]
MTRRARGRAPIGLAAAALLVALACGGTTTPGPSPSAHPGPSAQTGPSPTPWPANTIEVAIALGAADAEIQEAASDLQAAVEDQDIVLMHDSAEQFATLLEAMLGRVGALTGYPGTAELGRGLEDAYTLMRDGTARIRDATTAGDSDGVVAGYLTVTEGLGRYAEVRPALAEAATQALFMRRNLVR